MANSSNPSIQGLKAALGPPQTAAPAPSGASQSPIAHPPDGSVAAYQPPSEGPFKCANCEYFVAESSGCQRPEVMTQVGDPDGDGLADVEAEGCCDFYSKAGQ